jgi:excisionase family DNA binding protein
MKKDDTLTASAAARLLGLSHTTVSKWVRGGLVESVKVVGYVHRRIPRSTVEAFLDGTHGGDIDGSRR